MKPTNPIYLGDYKLDPPDEDEEDDLPDDDDFPGIETEDLDDYLDPNAP